ncbi:glycine zipper 2TM domain-containing protein [Burkholderia glumae]|uniref:glycine zipper 2TM domain-containing protein n=1 Tax=Burkholderia glumae TaxID=337 RepID=UPI002151D285|nr:glycine zipper 2TM domain-containing protein [Burkholderia glumae]UVS96422.1 glycine zipper 2TM domain-containing protein [Burkholderia glumae]
MDNSNNATNSTASAPNKRLHPLVATAAGAVIVASLVATAAITGVLPKAGGTPAACTPPAAVDTAAPANGASGSAMMQAQQRMPAPAVARASTQSAPPATPQPQYAQQPAEPVSVCHTCGTVVAITETRTEGQATGLGAVGGAAAGGLVGNQFGRGGGRTAMTILGALGGGLAGNSVEKHLRSETDYHVRVRMENGTTRTFTYRNPPPFGEGQRVHVERGTLVAG